MYREIIKVVRHFLRRNYSRLRRLYRVSFDLMSYEMRSSSFSPQTFRAWRLERKEQRLLKKQEQIGKKYNVIKNVSTHSMLNDPDGKLFLGVK